MLTTQRVAMMDEKEAVPNRVKARRRCAEVPGQLYGYLLQVTRSVAHLLRAHQGRAVSVERPDDVATAGPNGVIAV